MSEEIVIDLVKKFPDCEISFRARWPRDNSWTVLFGPSGAGKTTVLRCLAGLEKPDRGTIRFDGETWFDSASRLFVAPQDRCIGYFFQEYALFPHLSVLNNIGYNLDKLSRTEKQNRIGEMLELFHLQGMEDRDIATLSGGEKQRVALARTLARRPRLLLLDEPLSALDGPTRIRLRKALRSLLPQFGLPILLVTHDRTEALSLGDRLIVMDQGRSLQEGSISEVFSKPNSKRTAEIVGMENVFPGRLVEKRQGLAYVRVGDTLLTVAGNHCEEGPVMVGIRAEDILLSTAAATIQSSARNRLHGVITQITPEEALVRVSVDCGFAIDALITREALQEMNLKESKKVDLTVKATVIHLFPHK